MFKIIKIKSEVQSKIYVNIKYRGKVMEYWGREKVKILTEGHPNDKK